MQRRDARSFLDEVLRLVPDVSSETRDALLALVADKPGAKRASKLAAVLAAEGEAEGEGE